MQGVKNKTYGLNLRRTYDVMKDDSKERKEVAEQSPQEGLKDEVVMDKGENRMTLNNKFKDFLLN